MFSNNDSSVSFKPRPKQTAGMVPIIIYDINLCVLFLLIDNNKDLISSKNITMILVSVPKCARISN